MLLGCLAVAAVLLVADLVLASTFRSFLLDRVGSGLAEAATAVVARADGPPGGPFGGFGGGPGGGPGAGQRPYSEYSFGLADRDGNLLVALGGGLGHDADVPQPDAAEIRAHITPAGAAHAVRRPAPVVHVRPPSPRLRGRLAARPARPSAA